MREELKKFLEKEYSEYNISKLIKENYLDNEEEWDIWYIDYIVGELLNEEYGSDINKVKKFYKIAIENAIEIEEYTIIADSIVSELEDYVWAKELYTIAIEKASTFKEYKKIADSIVSELKDYVWVKELYTIAIEKASTSKEYTNIASDITFYLKDYIWAKELYTIAIEKASTHKELIKIANDMRYSFNKSDIIFKKLYNKAIEKCNKFYHYLDVADSIAEIMEDCELAQNVYDKAKKLIKNSREQKSFDKRYEKYFIPIQYSTVHLLNKKDNIVINEKSMSIKNIILYGAPGVGKTHNINRLISLIEEGKSDVEIFESLKKNEYAENVDISDIKDRVKFVTFHQSFGYEDFIEGFRPNEEGKIELVDGIFKNICLEAQKNLDNSQKNTQTLKDDSDLYEKFINYVDEKIQNESPVYLKKGDSFYLNKFENNKLYFGTTDNAKAIEQFSLKYNDFEKIYKSDYQKETLKDISTILGTNSVQQKYAYYLYIYKDFKEYEKNLKTDDSNYKFDISDNISKNYYLIIDEINRGNISKIFGELITLIEEDKRDTLEVVLPYSKETLKVPSNLYIIGTMNSTDKSIALIDIALRRRFTFLKMEPNAELIEHKKAKEIFKNLNSYISDSIGEDFKIGHSYFMKIQSDEELDFVLEYKIKPLLEEYYYGDNSRLKEILAMMEEI